jgi:beta-glucosidase
MTANPVLRDVVMHDWGFDGIVCTDAGTLTNLVMKQHAFQSMPEAVAAATPLSGQKRISPQFWR